jgi:hypothetical protein
MRATQTLHSGGRVFPVAGGSPPRLNFQGFHGGQYTVAELAGQFNDLRDSLTPDLLVETLRKQRNRRRSPLRR